jgi:nicotinate-nucleotide adenylyltransferase
VSVHVALLGGSFNPPHVVHPMIALYALSIRDVDEVWMVPSFRHPFRKSLADYEDRVEMCRRAAAPLAPRVKVSRAESLLAGPGYTVELLRHLRDACPQHHFSLILGADVVRELPAWYRASLLPRLADLIIVGRRGPGPSSDAAIQMPSVSSTDVRRRLASGEPVDALVPQAVLRYIRERALYGA